MTPERRGGEVRAGLVDNMINMEVPAVAPARGALIALLEMEPSERTQGWFPKRFDYGMYLPENRSRRFASSRRR